MLPSPNGLCDPPDPNEDHMIIGGTTINATPKFTFKPKKNQEKRQVRSTDEAPHSSIQQREVEESNPKPISPILSLLNNQMMYAPH